MKDYTLVILAAGMGSRYGGTKQLDAVSKNGETIMDFSLFDAVKAGFTKVVFIVRKDILEEVKSDFGAKLEGKVKVEYVIQETTKIPEKYNDNQRSKPWGTGHALLMAKEVVKENFCVINADDFYGYNAFETILAFLKKLDVQSKDYAMVGYPIINTLSDNGSVSRGETFLDEKHNLKKIIERTSITKQGDKITFKADNGEEGIIAKETLVSLNFWGFSPTFFDYLSEEFNIFLEENSKEAKTEFFLPFVVDELIQRNISNVSVLSTSAKWMGVTYKEDKQIVVNKVSQLIEQGVYPVKLW